MPVFEVFAFANFPREFLPVRLATSCSCDSFQEPEVVSKFLPSRPVTAWRAKSERIEMKHEK
jgi:hypothetical protein